MQKNTKIYIAGHNGMVGSAIWRTLTAKGYTNLVGVSSKELNLKNQQAVKDFFAKEKPEVVIDAAAKVGGILANNDFPYQFLMENMQIQNNLIDTALQSGVEKFIFRGSSCIYTKLVPQSLKERSGLLTLCNHQIWYNFAKIAGVAVFQVIIKKLDKSFISLLGPNPDGTHGNFDCIN
jgi:GDP-L-fucose synthase